MGNSRDLAIANMKTPVCRLLGFERFHLVNILLKVDLLSELVHIYPQNFWFFSPIEGIQYFSCKIFINLTLPTKTMIHLFCRGPNIWPASQHRK